ANAPPQIFFFFSHYPSCNTFD
ncbi:hypothetical protein CCACVL1_01894, partial [Corchorus capsularis]